MFPCQRYQIPPLSRRQMLTQAANGFGAVALSSMLTDRIVTANDVVASDTVTSKPTHFPAKAKHVIFLYMDGGPSQVDTFDPKPMLDKHHGKSPQEILGKVEPTQFANIGKLLKSPWAFKNYGECGLPVSDLFPHVGECADELAVVRSVVSPFSEHTFANYFLHS
ncbi:MAG TPA: DUF1501 domain-containing protein, partial [Schlesneria sp.]